MELLTQIEEHIKTHRMAPTRFGREAVGDPKLVFQLREGREPRRRTIIRILDYLNDAEGETVCAR
ncbi:MAG TPA: hypothetical protein VGB59_03470 [Allosphingosinicella sp.]